MNQKNTTKDDSQLLANQLCHRFYVISNAITRKYKSALDALDLTYPQYVVMMALWEKDDISISELQQVTLIDIGCLSVMLKKMQAKGFIELIASATDKRMKKVKLSDKGIKLQALAQREREQLQQEKQSLNEEEFQQLITLLDTLKAGLINST